MRWKLIILASFVAALIGVLVPVALLFALAWDGMTKFKIRLAVFFFILIPLAAFAVAGLFVYRHTAQRRRFQGATASVLSLLLAVTIFFLGYQIFYWFVFISHS